MMLEDILRYCNRLRYDDDFVREALTGSFVIENGGITPLYLKDGQYFCIWGSDFNDGVHQYPGELTDEAFYGTVWVLALPKAFLALVSDMEAWEQKNGAAAAGPYQSESFGGYSYSKATGANGEAATVWSAFKARLSEWRKI